ncbi:MAG: murein biosynthesis integral membrane protein MurJ [Candidatus Limnocylindrales bacterium]
MIGRSLARAGAVVVAAFFVSRLLGWLRIVIIGNIFGAGPELDAYFAAFRIPDLIFQLVAAGAISSALIPVLTGLIHDGEETRGMRVVSTVLNTMLLVLLGFAAVMFIFAPQIVPILVSGFDGPTTDLTVRLTRIMLVAPVLLAAGAVASSVLNTKGRFGAAALAPLLYNLAIIGSAIVLSGPMGIDSLAVGVVIGAMLHVAIQIPRLRDWRYTPTLDLKDPAARQVVRLLLPRSIGLGATQITFIVNTSLATLVSVGAVTIYSLAFTIFLIPVGVIGMPLGVLLLPSMSRAIAARDMRSFGTLLIGALRMLAYVMAFFAVIGIVVSRQIVGLLFDYGGFDAAALERTALTLAIFLIGAPASALCVILARAFYSDRDTTTPLVGVAVFVAVDIVVSVLTIGPYGLFGLAAGVALGDWAEAAFLTIMLRRRIPGIGVGDFVVSLPIIALGAGLAGLAATAALRVLHFLGSGKLGLVLQAGVATAVGVAVYVAYSRAVKLPELPRAIRLVRTALSRGTDPDPAIEAGTPPDA